MTYAHNTLNEIELADITIEVCRAALEEAHANRSRAIREHDTAEAILAGLDDGDVERDEVADLMNDEGIPYETAEAILCHHLGATS